MENTKTLLTYNKLMKETYAKLQEDSNRLRRDLEQFLSKADVSDVYNKSARLLVSKLYDLQIMFKDKEYVAFQFDKEGYIIDKVPVTNFIEDKLPLDITRGYYKLVDGKVEIDHVKKRIITEV